ncbi:Transcriptional regulator, TetR family [Candidatus Paraburkholderia calva]|nr:Transcriptional regulator, TetR family [Candidatus Paraburkholderia calva]
MYAAQFTYVRIYDAMPHNFESLTVTQSIADQLKALAQRIVRTDGATAQAQLLDAAQELFYHDSIRAIGVEAVVERAGINKMSLYRWFASKEDLVTAYLDRMQKRFEHRFETSVEKHPNDPRALAESLALLVDGIYATSQTYGPGSGPMMSAPRIARTLIDAACASTHTQEN